MTKLTGSLKRNTFKIVKYFKALNQKVTTHKHRFRDFEKNTLRKGK
jgi:hypothetical protein